MTGFSVLWFGADKDLDASLDGDLECLNWAGAEVGGLDEATTWSSEVEVLVSLLAVMAMICQLSVQR